MEQVLLKCGCVSNSLATIKGIQVPWCVIHDTGELAKVTPDLKNRVARCTDCTKRTPSALTLPYFSYLPDRKEDSYYCGCRGWE